MNPERQAELAAIKALNRVKNYKPTNPENSNKQTNEQNNYHHTSNKPSNTATYVVHTYLTNRNANITFNPTTKTYTFELNYEFADNTTKNIKFNVTTNIEDKNTLNDNELLVDKNTTIDYAAITTYKDFRNLPYTFRDDQNKDYIKMNSKYFKSDFIKLCIVINENNINAFSYMLNRVFKNYTDDEIFFVSYTLRSGNEIFLFINLTKNIIVFIDRNYHDLTRTKVFETIDSTDFSAEELNHNIGFNIEKINETDELNTTTKIEAIDETQYDDIKIKFNEIKSVDDPLEVENHKYIIHPVDHVYAYNIQTTEPTTTTGGTKSKTKYKTKSRKNTKRKHRAATKRVALKSKSRLIA